MKRTAERGFTLVEIMIVVAIIALLAAIAIPNILRGRATANEAAAIGNLRALVSSLEMFRSSQATYPTVAQTWATPMFPGAGVPAFAPPSFNLPLETAGGGTVQGYIYRYRDGATAGQQYQLVAVPATLNQTGTKSFFVNESGTLQHCTGTAVTFTTAAWAAVPTIDAAPAVGCP